LELGMGWFRALLKEYEGDFDFRLERLVLDLTEQIAKAMHEKGMSRADLAHRLDVSPATVTRILRGNSDFKLRTLLAIADALRKELKIGFVEPRANRRRY